MAKAKEKTYQEKLNDIDNKIAELQKEKSTLAKLVLKELATKVEMPLHQTNLIARIGYEKAKKQCGTNWVE